MESNLQIMKLIGKKDMLDCMETKQLIDSKIENGYIVECNKEQHDYFTVYHIKWYEKIK